MDKRPLMKKVKTPEEACVFLRMCVREIGEGFHPDILGADYENRKSKRTFTSAQAWKFDTNMRKVFDFIKDPCKVALDLYNVQYGRKD